MNIDKILTNDQKIVTTKLFDKIKLYINDHGPITVAKYMDFALYDYQFGYYTNDLIKFQDFSTAPMISDIFSISIANHFIEIFNAGEINKNIMEIGAGNGQFIVDILPLIINQISKYTILEISPELQKIQKQRILKLNKTYLEKIEWVDTIPSNFNGIIFANELLDAIPCEVINYNNKQFFLRYVEHINNSFSYLDKKIDDHKILENLNTKLIPHDKFIFEINPLMQNFLDNIAKSLFKGYILLIDYGYSESGLLSNNKSNGTLRGFLKNNLIYDIIQLPGVIDITSSVNFTNVANQFEINKMDFIGYCSQSNFLINNNILEIINKRKQNITSNEYLNLTTKINYLLGLEEMGEIFKVIEYSKNVNYNDIKGFNYGDLSHTL